MSHDLQQAITHVLQQDSKVLDKLFHKLKLLKQLSQILGNYLGEKLANHCTVASFEKGCMIVITDNAIWATQFRFQIPSLIPKLHLHEECQPLKNIVCKIRPKNMPPQDKPAVVVSRLSLETAAMIKEAAKTITHDRLRKTMERIALNIKGHNS